MFGGHFHGRAVLHEMEARIKTGYGNAKRRAEKARMQYQIDSEIDSIRRPGLLDRMVRVILRRPHKGDNP